MHSVEMTSRRSSRTAVCASLLCLLLALAGASCGQRGPLYLPGEKAASPAAEPGPDEPPQQQGGTDGSEAPSDRDEKEDEATPRA
jgi:predicted small lipoprotein YifL